MNIQPTPTEAELAAVEARIPARVEDEWVKAYEQIQVEFILAANRVLANMQHLPLSDRHPYEESIGRFASTISMARELQAWRKFGGRIHSVIEDYLTGQAGPQDFGGATLALEPELLWLLGKSHINPTRFPLEDLP